MIKAGYYLTLVSVLVHNICCNLEPGVWNFENLPEPQALSSSSFIESLDLSTSSSATDSDRERAKREAVEDSPSLSSGNGHNTPQYRMPKDGVYLVVVHVWSPVPTQHFTASVHLEMQSPTSSGYLSITDYPLLPFYAVMCAVYV